MALSVGIIGGSGYTGGELLRLLLNHPQVEVTQITSRDSAGQYVYTTHPHLRGLTRLQFIHPDAMQPCDVLFLALPHGTAAHNIEHYASLAPTIIDLSADFRLNDPAEYQRWYGEAHPAPEWLNKFVYGLPEVNREALRTASYASGVGCNATAINLALRPLVQAGLVEYAAMELKVGSSEGGASTSASSHHPIRSGTVRTYKTTQHRHTAEVEMILGCDVKIHFAITSVELVRGIHALAHVTLRQRVAEKDIWQVYRTVYGNEPFIRIVTSKTGLYRLPEPRIVAGTNFCDIGFELDTDGQHLIVVSALDNLGKGAAGSAVQCMNLMRGFDEMTGLRLAAAYP